MKQTEHVQAFEQVLLSYAAMCYSVAFALTRNPEDARNLTREVLIWAWHLRDSADAMMDIKRTLLIALRKRFQQDCRQVPCALRDEAVRAERT